MRLLLKAAFNMAAGHVRDRGGNQHPEGGEFVSLPGPK